MLGRQLQAALPGLLVLLSSAFLNRLAAAVNVNVTLPKDLLEPPGAGRFTPRLILAVEVNAAVLSTASYDEFARNTSSALGSYLYSLFPDTFTLADGTLCSGCVQAGSPVRGLRDVIMIDSEEIQPGYALFMYTIWLPNNTDEGLYLDIEGTLRAQSLGTLFAASGFTDQMLEIEKILDTKELQEEFTVGADMMDFLAATTRLEKVAILTGEKLLESSNATDVTIVASNDNHSNNMGKRVTVAVSRNNLTSTAGLSMTFDTSPEASENTTMAGIFYPKGAVSDWCSGARGNNTDCGSGEGLITTKAYWFGSSQDFAAVTDGTSGLISLREQLESGNVTRKLASSHSGEGQPLLYVPEVSVVSGVLEAKAIYKNYLSAQLEAQLDIPIQADMQAGRLTSCVRLEQARTRLGFVATYLPSHTEQRGPNTVTCRAQLPGRYLVVQLNESLGDDPLPDAGSLPPAQQIEQLLSQALELGRDIVPPGFSEAFSFVAMVDERLLDGQGYRTLADLANDIQRSLAAFLSQNGPLGGIFREIGPCFACFEVVDMAGQGSLPDWDLIGALVPSAASIRYKVHLPLEVPGLDVQTIAKTDILTQPLESILGSTPAQQMVLFFQQASDTAEDLGRDLTNYFGYRYAQVESQLRSAYQIGKSLVEIADSSDIGTTLVANYGSIDAAFSRIAAAAAVTSPGISFQVNPAHGSADITAGVQIKTPSRAEWCSRVDCNGGLLETLIVYYQNVEKLDLDMDMIIDLLNRASILEAIPLSGVLDVQSVLKDSSTNQTTLLCNFEGEGCRLNLQIPVDKSQWNPAAVVQCVHLGGGFFEGLQSFGSSIVDALTSGPAGSDVPDTVNCITDTTGWHILVGLIPKRPGPPLELALSIFPLMFPGSLDLGLPSLNGSLDEGLSSSNGSFIDKLYETAPSLMMALGLLDSNGTRLSCDECIEVPSTGQVPSPLEALDALMRIWPDPSIASVEELYAMLWEERSSILNSEGLRFGEVAYIFPPTSGLENLAAELPKFVINMTITLEVDSGTLPPADDIIPPESDDRIPDLGIGGRRSLKVEIPDLGIDLSDVKDQINQALMPALETALNRSTSNLGNPLQDIEITADYNFEPGEMYSAEVHVTIPSAFLIRDKLDAFMVVLEAETQGGLSISSKITIKVSSMSGSFIPPRPPQFPPPGAVPPPPPLSLCDLCEDCVARVYNEVVRFALEFRSSFGMDPFSGLLMPDGPAIPQEFPQQVLRKLCPRSINEDACKEALSEIKAPELLRAAALCNHLGQCSPEDECQIASQRTDGQIAEMDFCTTDGTVNGKLIGQKSADLDGDDFCFSDEDCSDGETFQFCDKSGGNTTVKSYCNDQGFEVVKVQGECANECRLPQVVGLIEESEAVTNCTSNQDCPEGESCEDSRPSCKIYSCDEETGQVTSEPCNKICLPTASSTTLGSAYFEDNGGVVRVNLSTPAAEISLPCTVLFGGDAVQQLGSSAECKATGQELVIGLSGDASIRPNETLTLKENQKALVAASSGIPFSGESGSIQSCSSCAQPQAVLSGPSTMAPACKGTEFEVVTISGAKSSSPAGRSFDDVTWELVDHPSEYQPSDSEDSMKRLLEDASQKNRLAITMGKDTLESMPASDEPYKIKLSVTSFLGTSHSTTHSIKRANSTGTPTVIITTPSRAKVTQGITLDAEASRSSVCGKGEYKWSCEGRTPAGASSSEPCSLLENEFGRRLNRKISMSELQQQGVQPGDKLTFKLVARYENQPDSESEAETEVEMLGADLQARLDGPSGTVQQSTDELVFNASGSSDPIASGDQNSGMEYLFGCTRLDAEGGYCFEPLSYRPAQQGLGDPTWTINATNFAAPDTTYLITVTVSKAGRTATASSVILLKSGEVTGVSVTRYCGGRQTTCPSTHNPTEPLSLAASVEISQGSILPDASYSWSFTDDQAAESGMQLNEDNTASGTTSYAVVLRQEAIPRSGFVAVQCNVSFPTGASGTGIIRVPLHRPPVCTSSDGCLEILGGEDGQNKTFPSVDFPATASGFSSPDEDETLSYEFGFKNGDSFEASGSATPSNEHTFIATEGPGKYIPYVCAIDSRGARTCSESSFTLNSNSNISESEVQSLLDGIDFVGLQDTGDDDAIFDGVSRLAAQLKGVQDSNDDDSSIGSNEVVAALEILNATLNDGGKDVSTAVTAISRQYDISDFATRSTNANEKAGETTISALKLIEKGQSDNANPTSPSIAGKALSNLGNIGSRLSGDQGRSLLAVTDETKTKLDRVSYAIKVIGRELADQVSPGSTLVSDGGNIAMAAIRDSYQSLSGANAEFSPSASGGARAGVFFQQSLADWCSQTADCNLQDRVTAVMAYVSDSSVYTAVTENWPNIESTLDSAIQGQQGTDYGAISNIEAISGAMGIEVGGQNSGPLCESPGCTMSVRIPVDVGMYNDSRELACARLSPPAGISSSTDLPLTIGITSTSGNLGVTGGTVTCDTAHLGTHFIVQYDLASADLTGDGNAPPPFPPSNPTEEVNVSPLPPFPPTIGDDNASPPPPSAGETLPERRSGAKSITITTTLNVDYDNVTESAESEQEFKNDVTRTVAENLRDVNEDLMTLENGELCYECVRVVGELRQGSVIVDIEVDLPDSTDEETLNSFADEVDKADSQLFANSRFEDKVMSLSAEGSGAFHVLAGLATAIIPPLIMLQAFLL